jgi:hypothetical protein
VMWPLAPNPPCKQMLTAVGVGCWALVLSFSSLALSPVIVAETQVQTTLRADAHRRGAGAVVVSSPSPLAPRCHSLSPLSPSPHGRGGRYHPPFPLPLLHLPVVPMHLHPVSTLRAVARSSGGGVVGSIAGGGWPWPMLVVLVLVGMGACALSLSCLVRVVVGGQCRMVGVRGWGEYLACTLHGPPGISWHPACAVLLSDSRPITCPMSRGSQQWGRVEWAAGQRFEVLFLA